MLRTGSHRGRDGCAHFSSGLRVTGGRCTRKRVSLFSRRALRDHLPGPLRDLLGRIARVMASRLLEQQPQVLLVRHLRGDDGLGAQA